MRWQRCERDTLFSFFSVRHTALLPAFPAAQGRDPNFMKTTVIIKKNRDFTRMYRRAKSQTGPLLVTYCARNRLGRNRIGITASKRVGDAVRRNRAKRVIRAAYTDLEGQLPQGYDFVFVARSRTAHCKMQPVQQLMLRQITELCGVPAQTGETAP